MQSLDEIALSLDPSPDKATNCHGYTPHYAAHFDALRDRPITLLEIGVWEGASLRMWREYFTHPAARVIGADIDLSRYKPEGWYVPVVLADQTKADDMARIAAEFGPFDIIIDDGSHLWHHQRQTFGYLWGAVKPGGYYCVEDCQTSYWHEPPRGEGETFTEWSKNLIDDVHHRGKSAPARFENVSADELQHFTQMEREIQSVHYYPYLTVIEKRRT